MAVHHITAIAGDPQRNLDFYAGTLGLRLVKLTVNFDDTAHTNSTRRMRWDVLLDSSPSSPGRRPRGRGHRQAAPCLCYPISIAGVLDRAIAEPQHQVQRPCPPLR